MDKKVILITGASSGIGYDAARRLSEQGHRVYGAARRLEKMEGLKACGVVPLRVDVTDEASMAAGVQQVLSAEGHITPRISNSLLRAACCRCRLPCSCVRRDRSRCISTCRLPDGTTSI